MTTNNFALATDSNGVVLGAAVSFAVIGTLIFASY
jgi:hypothetical protein